MGGVQNQAHGPPVRAPLPHLDRLSVAGPQQALVICLNAEGHEGSGGDVPPVPTRCHALSALEKQGERRQVRSMLGTLTPGSMKRRSRAQRRVDTHVTQEATRCQSPVGHVVGAGVSEFKGHTCVPPASEFAGVDNLGLG